MISKWTSNLKSAADKEKFAKEVSGSKNVLERLETILTELNTELDQIETNPKFYELPNWDYRQASNNGYRRALATVRKIINLDQQDLNTNDR